MYKITENKKIIDSIKNKKFTKKNMTKLATENNIKIKIEILMVLMMTKS